MRKMLLIVSLVLLFAGNSASATEAKKKVQVDEASLMLGKYTQAYLVSIFVDESIKVDQEAKDTKAATSPTAKKVSESRSK